MEGRRKMKPKPLLGIILTVLLIGTSSLMLSRLPIASASANDGTKGAPDQEPDPYEPGISSPGSSIRLGIWLPRYDGDIPPYNDLSLAGIHATDVTVLDATTLPNFDVVFIGRGGFWVHAGQGTLDTQAIKNWVSNGGGIIGESEAVISDSVNTVGNQWSPQLSEIFGVWSTQAESYDYYVGDSPAIISVVDSTHPLTTGLSENFSATVYSTEFYAYIDLGRNPTAKKILEVRVPPWDPLTMPIVAAEYGQGKAVYFPYCPDGYTEWASQGGQNLEKLFINAVTWTGTHAHVVGGYSSSIQVFTLAAPVLTYITSMAALTVIYTKLRPRTKRKHSF